MPNAGKMPPWPPLDDCSAEIVGDRRLNQEDITAVNDWVNAGAPAGDLATAPPPPTDFSTSQLNQVNQTVQLPVYSVKLQTDEYRTFVVHSGYASAQYLNQIEVIPGNNAIVHHVLVYYDSTNTSYNLDAADPDPGFSTNGTNTPSDYAILVGGWAPGAQPQILPSNMAYRIPANSDFVVEVHYAPNNLGKTDSTKINIKFCDQANPRLMSVAPILFHFWPSLINGPLIIPANTTKTFYEKSVGFTYPVDGNYSLFAALPHMHLIGKSISVYMTSPNNADTTRLVCIPDWSFHWQLGYIFRHMIHFPSSNGYTLRAEATYDNTSNNPNNPNNPPITVSLGESTLDEMMVVFFTFLDYQTGDEDIDMGTVGVNEIDNNGFNAELFPNPAADELQLSCWLQSGDDLTIQILNSSGAVMKTIDPGHQPKGAYASSISISDLPNGIYFLQLQSDGQKVLKKFVKAE